MATKEEYNSVPVEFCSKATCCSLNIKEDEDGSVYCDDCGGLKVSKAPIEVWEDYWMMAHGEKLLNIKRPEVYGCDYDNMTIKSKDATTEND